MMRTSHVPDDTTRATVRPVPATRFMPSLVERVLYPVGLHTRRSTHMPVRNAEATWNGNLKEGKGSVKLGSGAFEGKYSFGTRFEGAPGTNPEELIGAAHAG